MAAERERQAASAAAVEQDAALRHAQHEHQAAGAAAKRLQVCIPFFANYHETLQRTQQLNNFMTVYYKDKDENALRSMNVKMQRAQGGHSCC